MNVIDLLEEMGIHPKRVASCKGGEYHSCCPDSQCGGKDRFCVWPEEGSNGRYWCRQCLKSGDAIQFCRDFMGRDFKTACAKVGKRPALITSRKIIPIRSKFTPKQTLKPQDQWIQQANILIKKAHQHLIKNAYLLNQDKDRGLTEQEIAKFQLGWNPTDIFEPGSQWGIHEENEDVKKRTVCVPKGIIIPSFQNNTPTRIKIRRHDWADGDTYPKYQIVAGSTATPSLYGNVTNAIVIVEAELDAMLIQRFCSDKCSCIALGGVSMRPDTAIDQLLCAASTVLYALDFDEAGKQAYKFWRSTYQHIKPWPVPKGKSPGDAYALSVDIKRWLDNGLTISVQQRISW